ncbi:MAG: DUF523 domain-containing protein [Alteromonadaceae bacterium]|nr:DUF523 domain-containing protein [Alteromonadaceae bacterium]
MEKILVSACLLGERVRYNAEVISLSDEIFNEWHQEGRLVSICPEVTGGLSIPRAPAEIEQSSGKVFTKDGDDKTDAFMIGANKALLLCQRYNIKYALLKESSPSCGSKLIYDGHFAEKKISGQGITTKLLREYGIKVFSEKNIAELEKLLK